MSFRSRASLRLGATEAPDRFGMRMWMANPARKAKAKAMAASGTVTARRPDRPDQPDQPRRDAARRAHPDGGARRARLASCPVRPAQDGGRRGLRLGRQLPGRSRRAAHVRDAGRHGAACSGRRGRPRDPRARSRDPAGELRHRAGRVIRGVRRSVAVPPPAWSGRTIWWTTGSIPARRRHIPHRSAVTAHPRTGYRASDHHHASTTPEAGGEGGKGDLAARCGSLARPRPRYASNGPMTGTPVRSKSSRLRVTTVSHARERSRR